jgi:hypothetical protein
VLLAGAARYASWEREVVMAMDEPDSDESARRLVPLGRVKDDLLQRPEVRNRIESLPRMASSRSRLPSSSCASSFLTAH